MRKRAHPHFKRGDRVEWLDGAGGPPASPQRFTGTVCEVHKLGSYGYHYEVRPDPKCATDKRPLPTLELQEGELAHASLLERLAEAADAQSTGVAPKSKRSKRK